MMMTNFKWSTILLVHVLLLLIVTEIYASPPTPPPENSYDEFGEQRNNLVVDKVKRIVYGWRQLSHQERNQFKNQVKEIPDNTLQTNNDPTFNQIRAQSDKVFEGIELYVRLSYLYYYVNMHWKLDRTPDSNDYWMGLYKVGAPNTDYLACKKIGTSSAPSGWHEVGKLDTTHYSYSKDRYEKFELRFFKGAYRRTDAVSNILHGVVHSPSLDINTVKTLTPANDETEIEPKLEAFLSAIEVVVNGPPQSELEELLSASYHSQEELLQLWSEFNKQEQQLLFPILEQDSLPDEIKKPSHTQSNDCQAKTLYPNLKDNLELKGGTGNAPRKITLNIKVTNSWTYVYPNIKTKTALSQSHAWVGVYSTWSYYNPNKAGKRWQWVGPGYGKNKVTEINSFSEHNSTGTLKNAYVGAVFDWSSSQSKYVRIGFASDMIQAIISATPAAPVPKYDNGFPVDQALTMAELSRIAYKDYGTEVYTRVQNYRLRSVYRIHDSWTDTNGYIATNSTTLVVAFRGTKSFHNALTDLGFIRKSQITEATNAEGHIGFVLALNTIYESAKNKVLRELGDKKLYITGHSLGCGLASLFAYRLAVEHNMQPNLFGYGCPPTGDTTYSEFFKGRPSYIITNPRDLVSDGGILFGGPALGLYKPRQVYYLSDPGILTLNTHPISVYIKQLKKLPRK